LDRNTISISENYIEDDLILGDSITIVFEEAKLGSNDAQFLTTIVSLLHRGDVKVLKGFVQLFIKFARSTLNNHGYMNMASALDFFCSKLLFCILPLQIYQRVPFGITMVKDLVVIIDVIWPSNQFLMKNYAKS
jgi:hypothetical protein